MKYPCVAYGVNYITDIDMPDLCSTAVMEAKKWLEEKKLTDSKDLDHAAGTLNSVSLPPVSYSFIHFFSYWVGGLLVMCKSACVFGCYMHAYKYCCSIVLNLDALIRNMQL